MPFRKIILLLLIIAGAQPCFADIKSEVAKTIVQIRSGFYATGFFWGNQNTILTTLHAIGNPNTVEVHIAKTNSWIKASVIRVCKDCDLVLLRVNDFSSPSFIASRYTTRPAVDTRVFTVGYNEGTIAYQDRDFSIGLLQGNTLNDLLPVTAKKSIKDLGFPSLYTEIVYLKGQLLHGFSGSPIVDYQGHLIGIADGGLENGAAGISWCIDASSLTKLENSNEGFPQLNHIKVTTLFAGGQVSSEPERYLQFKQYKIHKEKTRTFAQLDKTGNYSSMDGMGLNQLLASFQQTGQDYNSFSFDIYVEEYSGATFVIPTGMTIRNEGGFLVAYSKSGLLKMKIDIQPFNNVQMVSEAYEYAIMPGINNYNLYQSYWQPDNRWTYMTPIPRPDGMIVRRKAYASPSLRKYVFEALVAKGNTFLGSAVEMSNTINNPDYTLPAVQTEIARFDLAIQLATFSY